MANKRDTSKQKRAKENRAQRDALKARTVSASTPRPSRQAPAASARSSAKATGGKAAGGKTRPPRPPRPGDTPVDIETLEGNWYVKRLQVPGGRQVFTAAVLTVVLTVLSFIQKYPDGTKKDGKLLYTETLLEHFGALAVPIVGGPLLAAALALYFTLSPNRRRIWIGCSMLAVTGIALGITYVFPAGFLTYAVMRSGRIEGPNPNSRAGRTAAAAADRDDAEVGDGDDDGADETES